MFALALYKLEESLPGINKAIRIIKNFSSRCNLNNYILFKKETNMYY